MGGVILFHQPLFLFLSFLCAVFSAVLPVSWFPEGAIAGAPEGRALKTKTSGEATAIVE